MLHIILFFSSFFLTLFLTPYLIGFLIKYGIIDKPESRRINQVNIPRMGGLVLIFVNSVLFLISFKDLNMVRYIILSVAILTVSGIIDDLKNINYKSKFIYQALASFLLILHFLPSINTYTIGSFILPNYAGFIILFILVIGLINSLNMMDGADGLLTSISLMITLILFIISYYVGNIFVQLISITLLGSLLAFLKFNSFPAKIFLGDTGSSFLAIALIIATFDSIIQRYGGRFDLLIPIILFGLPLIDTLKVIVHRVLMGKSPFNADKSHLHHFLIDLNIKHRTVVFIIQFLFIPFIILAILYFRGPDSIYLLLFILLSIIILFSKNIVGLIISKTRIVGIYARFRNLLHKAVLLFDKLFPLVLLAAPPIIVLSTIPIEILIENEIPLLLIAIIFLLFIVAFYHNRIFEGKRHFYVFLNLFFFFFIINTKFLGFAEYNGSTIIESRIIYYLSLFLLILIVIYYLILRDRLIPVNRDFFSGIELTIIPLTLLTYILSNIFHKEILLPLSISMIVSFIIYLSYRIFVVTRNKFSNVLFYGSFLPLLILIIPLLL